MAQPSNFMDISKIPETERPHIIELAQKHNALAEDVNAVTGETLEEKKQIWFIFGAFRFITNHWQTTKGSYFVLLVCITLGTHILERLGVDLKAFGPLMMSFIQALTNLMNNLK